MTRPPSTSPSSAVAPVEEGEDALRLPDRAHGAVRAAHPRRPQPVGHVAGAGAGPRRSPGPAGERLGPVRQRTLAEALHADPSTPSRQVAFLVDNGLLRRTADADDGRACLLEVTSGGAELTDGLRRRREQYLAGVLADWTPAERATFTHLFGRFVDGLSMLVDAPPPAELVDVSARTR